MPPRGGAAWQVLTGDKKGVVGGGGVLRRLVGAAIEDGVDLGLREIGRKPFLGDLASRDHAGVEGHRHPSVGDVAQELVACGAGRVGPGRTGAC